MPTCLMGMARPLPMESALQSGVFFSRSMSAPFRDWKRRDRQRLELRERRGRSSRMGQSERQPPPRLQTSHCHPPLTRDDARVWAFHAPPGTTGWDDRQAWDGRSAERRGQRERKRKQRRRQTAAEAPAEAQKGRHSPTNPTVYLVNTRLAPYKVVAEVTGPLSVPYKSASTINSYFTLRTGFVGWGSGRGRERERKEGRKSKNSIVIIIIILIN